MAAIKNNVRSLRKELQLRQEDLAELVGVTRQTIIAIENQRYNPSLELGLKLAKILKRTVEETFQLEID